MELTDIKIFLEVARYQSISRAAAGMHMGQPTVSQRVTMLEKEIGNALFIRHRRGVRLTDSGMLFLGYAERVKQLVDEGVQAVRDLGGSALQIRLAGPSSVNGYFLFPLLQKLSDQGCNVVLRDAHSHEVMQSVLDGTIDAGFVIGIPAQPGIKRWTVHQDPVVCVASTSHPLRELSAQRALHLADLVNQRLVFYKFSYDFDALVHILEDIRGAKFQGVVETTPVESVKSLVMRGDCVSFVPRMTIQRELAAKEIVILPVHDLPHYTWNIAFIYRDRKVQPAATSTVRAVAASLWNAECNT